MTTNDIDAIRKLTDAATPGPWVHDGNDGLVWPERIGDPVSGSNEMADADFIAAARTHVPALCDEIEQLRAEVRSVTYRRAEEEEGRRMTTTYPTIPGQPDRIQDDSHDLPSPARAAKRLREYIAANGDGIYDVIDGHPLYARDLESLRRAGEQVGNLVMELAKVHRQLTAANHRADGLQADLNSAQQANTAYANENDTLRMQVYAQKPVIEAVQAWAEMREDGGIAPDDCRKTEDALFDAIEQYRLMDLALTTARDEQAEVAR